MKIFEEQTYIVKVKSPLRVEEEVLVNSQEIKQTIRRQLSHLGKIVVRYSTVEKIKNIFRSYLW